MKSIILFFFISFSGSLLHAQQADTLVHIQADTVAVKKAYKNIYQPFFDSSLFLNTKGIPQSYREIPAHHESLQLFFYIMVALLLCLGLMRTIFSRYFNTLFRVFFNTSLRQNQLTDQLTQAKLPSLIFNIFFVITAGVYVYFLLNYFLLKRSDVDWRLLRICILSVGACYLVKFLSLKLMGWITGYNREADTYIFIIFLFNKIEGIILLPFAVLIIFSVHSLVSGAVFLSVILLAVILLIRFFRSWSLLQNELKVTVFHFLLYIFALEILPIAFIYKAVRLFLGINQ